MRPEYGLALFSSVVFGTADFLGGYATRRASARTITFASGAAGLISLSIATPFFAGTPTAADLAWGMVAGLSGGLGVALLYRAFAIGPVSVAAPIISIVALCMPVVVGIARGERPSAVAIAGMALAAASFPLLSHTEGSDGTRLSPRRVLPIAFASGVLVGGFLVLIRQISSDAGMAPLFAARLATVVLFGVIVAMSREPFLPAREVARPTLAAGLLDSCANVGYFVAVHRGSLAIVGTIISLAPVTTVLLARLVLRERWTRAQHLGLALAVAAIVCVSLG